MAKNEEKQRELLTLIHADTKLEREQKMEYACIADIYLDKLKDNLSKTSIDLNETYPEIGIDKWREFLTVPVIRKYIQSFKDEQILIRADEGLMAGNKDAVSVKKVMQNQGPSINNQNIVLIRLPEKADFNGKALDVNIEVEVEGI